VVSVEETRPRPKPLPWAYRLTAVPEPAAR
jgi:hypothetical protein